MVINFKDYNILIINSYQMFIHLWNFLNLCQNLYIKSWWCHLLWWMPFGNPKRKTHQIHMNEGKSKYLKNMFNKHKNCEKQKKSISKRLLKIRFNFDPSKVHNYHLVYLFIFKNFTLDFIISPFKAYLVIINNLEWKIIWILQFTNNPINQLLHNFELWKFTINNELFSENSFTNVFIIIVLMYCQLLNDKFKIMLFNTTI